MTPRHLSLHDGWTLTADGPVPPALPAGGVPAAVPGCVHTDLLAAGLIDDPYLDDNEERLGWIGRTDWTYRTDFAWAADGHEFTDLCFDGLDTVATVLLNGTRIGSTANQHRSYRFPYGRCCARAPTPSSYASPPRTPMPRHCGTSSATGPVPTPSRTPSSGRWPATSAGTGAPPWSRPVSGGPSRWSPGPATASPR